MLEGRVGLKEEEAVKGRVGLNEGGFKEEGGQMRQRKREGG